MLPGKKYTPEDFLRIIWRRRWVVVLPFVLAAVGTAVVAYSLPNRYRSETTILIVPQRVPANYVPPTVTTQIEDRLQMISQQILSRTRLERIIQEFNLYERERKDMIMEDVIEQMRSNDIKVEIISGRRRQNDASAFKVAFHSEDARTAMLVTERLASLFIKENLEDRAVLADATSEFLETQLEDARRRLIEHEKMLEDYRRQHQGSLPTQLQSNLAGIQTTQQQLQALQESVAHDQERRFAIERQIAELRADVAPPSVASVDEAGQPVGGNAAQRLEFARAAVRAAELRLKPEHPDMQRMKRVVRDLEKEAEAEALRRPLSDGRPIAATPAEQARRTKINDLETEYNIVMRRLAGSQQEQERLQGSLAMYQQRVEQTPVRETEMVALLRDYETLKEGYTSLLAKNEASKMAANLERRQIGEQFRILDGARLPERPISPDRLRIDLMGAAAGLLVGLLFIGLLEYRDTTMKSEEDIVVSLALPVLALVPAMVTPAEERAMTRRKRLVAAASVAAVAVTAAVAALAWKLQLIDRWVR